MTEQCSLPFASTPTRYLLPSLFLGAALAGGVVYWASSQQPNKDAARPERPVQPLQPPPDVVKGPPWFHDVTASSGLDFTYHNDEEANQFALLESLGGGVALLDYDGDGLLDIFVTGGGYFDGPDKTQIKGHPSKLYKNLGNWKFKDVTKDVGLDGVAWWYTHGAAVADYDRDDWPDLLVTGYGKLALFHNEPDGNGGRRFVDVTAKVGLEDDSWSTGAGWGHLDRAG